MKRSTLVVLVLAGLPLGCGRTPPPPANVELTSPVSTEPGVRIDNPSFRLWAPFPIGTRVVHTSITEAIGNPNKSTTITTYRLLEKQAEMLVVELKTHTVRHDGFVIDNPPDRIQMTRQFELPPGATPPKVEQPTETVELTVVGKKYLCRKTAMKDRNEAGEVRVETWSSDEVPGGLVRSVSDTPAIQKRTIIEVTEVAIPQAVPKS